MPAEVMVMSSGNQSQETMDHAYEFDAPMHYDFMTLKETVSDTWFDDKSDDASSVGAKGALTLSQLLNNKDGKKMKAETAPSKVAVATVSQTAAPAARRRVPTAGKGKRKAEEQGDSRFTFFKRGITSNPPSTPAHAPQKGKKRATEVTKEDVQVVKGEVTGEEFVQYTSQLKDEDDSGDRKTLRRSSIASRRSSVLSSVSEDALNESNISRRRTSSGVNDASSPYSSASSVLNLTRESNDIRLEDLEEEDAEVIVRTPGTRSARMERSKSNARGSSVRPRTSAALVNKNVLGVPAVISKKRLTVPRSPQFATAIRKVYRNKDKPETTEERQMKEIEITRQVQHLRVQKKTGNMKVVKEAVKALERQTNQQAQKSAAPALTRPVAPRLRTNTRATLKPTTHLQANVYKKKVSLAPAPSHARAGKARLTEPKPFNFVTEKRILLKKGIKGETVNSTGFVPITQRKVIQPMKKNLEASNSRRLSERLRKIREMNLLKASKGPEDDKNQSKFKANPVDESILYGPPRGIPLLHPHKLTTPHSPLLLTKTRHAKTLDASDLLHVAVHNHAASHPHLHVSQLMTGNDTHAHSNLGELHISELGGVNTVLRSTKLTEPVPFNFSTDRRMMMKELAQVENDVPLGNKVANASHRKTLGAVNV